MSAVSTRRSLFAGAGAVVIGTGITAGAAASIADLVPLEPDAELLALCSEFVSLELAHRAIYDGPDAIPDDEEARVAAAPLDARSDALLDEMERVQAVSAAGIVARAKALAAHNSDFGFSFDDQETMAGRLLAGLLRDAAAIGLGA